MINKHCLKLNLCSLGDPSDPKTWSGTPYNIYSELLSRNQAGEPINAEAPYRLKQLLSGLSILFYGKVDLARQPIRRYMCALKALERTKRSTSLHTLHTGTLSLPFLVHPKSQFHYLFCDSTWNLWARYATNMESCPDRMVSLFESLEARAYSQMTHIFSISEYVKENLVAHYRVPSEKVTVVGTGLGAIKPFKGEKDYKDRKILFAAKGRFQDKGGELVIKAFQKALEKDSMLQLTVVGSEEAKKFSNYPNVTVLGFMPIQDLQDLFDSHSLFLMPALNEPWGLVYLEALACKMPIIGLQRNSFPEISGYGKYGFMIEEPSSELLANTLIEVFNKPERLKEMGEQGQAYCLNKFSWEKTVDLILQTIGERYVKKF